MTYFIELDFGVDQIQKVNGKTEISWNNKTLKEHGFNLETETTGRVGIHTGCPEIRFIGEKDEIIHLLREIYCVVCGETDEHLVKDYISFIEKDVYSKANRC